MAEISILIVEDEAVTAMFMERKLRLLGHNILKCISTGEEAIVYAAEHRPDIILMDIRLAGKIDGLEAAERIKSESDSPVRFIFTTGYSDTECRVKALSLDPAGFLVKPVNIAELTGIIDSSCNTLKPPVSPPKRARKRNTRVSK